MAYGLQTYQDGSRKETILDVFQDASPKSTPLMTLFKTGTARGTQDEWVEDYQARSTDSTGEVEGADATYSDLTAPQRRNNFTQIITRSVKVSGTEREVDVVGGQDPMSYQKSKELTALKLKWEYTIINGAAKASGSSGVARNMSGIKSIISSHLTNRDSGTSLSVAEINAVVKEQFDGTNSVGIENMFDLIVVPMGLKQKLGTLSTNITRVEEATTKRLTFPVQVLETDGGEHRIIPHQDVPGAAATPGPTALFLRESAWQIAWLRQPFFKPLASQGDNEKGEWISEGTLRYLAEKANAMRTGYNVNG